MKGTKWFTADYGYAARVIQDVVKNYKQYLSKSRKQPQYVKENFTLSKMSKIFCKLIDDGLKNVPQQIGLKLPKLKKMGATAAPTLKLPKLKKINT